VKARPNKRRPEQKRKPQVKQAHVVLPDEDFELLDRGDFIGLEYLRVRRLRAKRKLTGEERKILAEHDAVEARMQNNAKAVLDKARDAIDEGTILLLKLIRSRKLRHDYGEHSWDKAVECFTSRVRFMNEQSVRLAEDRTPKTCFHLWYQAMNLADAIVRLAAAFPEEFRRMAESSLIMPSLRARSSKFSCDAEAIAKAIHLAEKHAAPDIHDNRKRIGALCHFLVAQKVQEVEGARQEKQHFERAAKCHGEQDLIPDHVHPDWRTLYEESWKLPELRGNADAWWKGRIREMLRREFDRMRKNPTHNPGLWQELEKATDKGTENARWRALEKYCRNKLNQIAGNPSASA
jgi:hypothetical protein